ncbi:ABC transporter permease [Symbiobacterium thermophilum]|uniref:ABC transporter permease n=1 Tax=Symbiobacterium thermophilum TaxID=2734 RepID=UPI0035C71463
MSAAQKGSRLPLIAGGLLVGLLLLAAVFADEITAVSPHYWDARSSILEGRPPFPPGPGHPLGTDEWGRDVWSRVVYGTRWSLLFAALVTAGRMLIGLAATFAAVYGPRRLGWLVDKLYVMTTAIPPLVTYLLLLSSPVKNTIGLWPNVALTACVLTLVEWPRVAVTLKGRLQQLMAEPFVEGAVAVGGSRWHVFHIHLLPHLWPTLLHLVAAEMARALSVIAQMGIFGILFGGGIMVVGDARNPDRWYQVSGLPEWGSLLSDGRLQVLSRPWIAFPPAVAFLIAVTGFTLLSQGLEGLNLPVARIKERTTGPLSRRWRWALAALPLFGLLWYYQGLPWDRAAGIQALATRQAAALSAGDAEGYAGTVAPGSDALRADARLLAAALAGERVESVDVAMEEVRLRGARAQARLTMTVTFADRPPLHLSRPVDLVRRLGTWYVEDRELYTLRGYHVDVTAAFDPLNPSVEAISLRQRVNFLATAADHAYGRLLELFPEAASAGRPQIRLYESHEAFRAAVGAAAPPDALAWYNPGDPLRLSPEFLRGLMRWETERDLGYEFVKHISAAASGQPVALIDPIAMGLFERSTAGDLPYLPDPRRLVGTPLPDLAALFSTPVQSLGAAGQRAYATAAAELVRFLQDRLPAEELQGPALGRGWSLGALADRLGQTPETLAAEFEVFLHRQLQATSVLNVPAARSRVPEGLPDAIARRAEAAAGGDVEAFLRRTSPAHRDGWSAWLAAARRYGLVRYEASLLDWERNEGVALVLERLQFRDGRTVIGVVRQHWALEDAGWAAGPVESVWTGADGP